MGKELNIVLAFIVSISRISAEYDAENVGFPLFAHRSCSVLILISRLAVSVSSLRSKLICVLSLLCFCCYCNTLGALKK